MATCFQRLFCTYHMASVILGPIIFILVYGSFHFLCNLWCYVVAGRQQSWVEWFETHTNNMLALSNIPKFNLLSSPISTTMNWLGTYVTFCHLESNPVINLIRNYKPLTAVVKIWLMKVCTLLDRAFAVMSLMDLWCAMHNCYSKTFFLQPKALGCHTTGLTSDNFPPVSDGQNKLAYNVWYVSAEPSCCWCHTRNSTAMSCRQHICKHNTAKVIFLL